MGGGGGGFLSLGLSRTPMTYRTMPRSSAACTVPLSVASPSVTMMRTRRALGREPFSAVKVCSLREGNGGDGDTLGGHESAHRATRGGARSRD